jgi:FtsZ-binding cell division protein ZapB
MAAIRNILRHHTDRLNVILQTEDNGTTFAVRINAPTAACYRLFAEIDDYDNPQDANEAYCIYVMFTMGNLDIPTRCYHFFPNGRAPNMPTRRVYSMAPMAESHARIVRFGHARDNHYNMQGQNGCIMGMFAHAMDRQIAAEVGLPGPGTVLPPPPDVTALNTQITNLQGQVQTLQGQLDTANTNLQNVTQERDTLRNQVITVAQGREALRNQVTAVTQERDTAQRDLTAANAHTDQLRTDLQTATDQITQLTADLQAANDRANQLDTNLQTASNQIATLTNERDTVTQERDALQNQFRYVTPQVSRTHDPRDNDGSGGTGAQNNLGFTPV